MEDKTFDELVEERARARANELIEHKSTPSFEIEKPEMKVEVDPAKSVVEQAKEFVGALATKNAVEDETLQQALTEKKKEELLHDAAAHLKDEKAESRKADKKLQEANYGVFEGVANYAGIKKPLPDKMQRVLFSILSGIQVIFLILLGLPTSIVNIIADCVNSIVTKLSEISKAAKVLVLSLLTLAGIAAVFYLAYTLLKRYGII